MINHLQLYSIDDVKVTFGDHLSRDLLIAIFQGVPKIVKLHPEHNHPPNAVEREATLLRCQMRDECLKEPTKRPVDILKETIASSSGEVREYLEKNQESIRRDMRRVRSTQMSK